MYDVVVLGGGPGGYSAAIRASQLGGRVALVEAAEIGGTCVNRGCIPTKVWHSASGLIRRIACGNDIGIQASVDKIDFKTIVKRKRGVSQDIRQGMVSILRNNGVERVRGRGELKNRKEIVVGGKTYETEKIVIATGSVIEVPDIPGMGGAVMTTDQILEMERVPSSILIRGVDPIPVTMASLLSTLGCKVFMYSEASRVLPLEDNTIRQWVARGLKAQGVEIIKRVKEIHVEKGKSALRVLLSGSEESHIHVERILVCSRKPNTEGLNAEKVGIRIQQDHRIQVNEKLETEVRGVYAVGDAAGGWMFASAAMAMGIIAAENAMGLENLSFPVHLVPRVIWGHPQVGAVGLSEKEAKKQGHEVQVGEFPYAVNGLAMAGNNTEGTVKIVSDARYGEILGVHIVGANAAELIGEALLAIQLEATAQDLARGIRVHPSYSENIVDAARDVLDWALYLPKKK